MKTSIWTEGIDRRTFLKTGAVLTGGIATASTASATVKQETCTVHEGESAEVGDGMVTAYATTNAGGEVSTLGVHVDGDALASVDADEQKPHEGVVAHLSFPDAVDTYQFTFMGFHFNPVGHPPPEIYTVSHFDFHFYMMAEDTVEAIPLGVATYDVPDDQFPPGYTFGNPRLIEPEMGEHLLDETAPEFNNRSFTHTYVYGAYDPSIDPENPDGVKELQMEGETQEVPVFEGDGNARVHFVEPMVTTKFLSGLDEETAVGVATPTAFSTTDMYPTEYVMRPDQNDGVHVLIDGFKKFPGPGQ